MSHTTLHLASLHQHITSITHLHIFYLHSTTKFVKTSPQLTEAIERILHIYERLIINSGRLEEVEMRESWRLGAIEILEVLESVRPIANRTDTVLPMLIRVDMFIHWTENMGFDGVPFPNWKKALFPKEESIAGHPWLLMVKCHYDMVGQQLQKPQPMPEQEATTSTMTILTLPPSSVGTMRQTPVRQTSVRWTPHMASCKGKEQVISEEMEVKSMDNRGDDDLYDDGESEVSDKVAEVDEEVVKTCQGSTRDHGCDDENETIQKPKYGQAQFMEHTTPPPNPESCGTCVNHKVICT
ncbi:hypothetical protein EDC04DRAFT_2905620 [Pisolithus marmoratus]|nr:hypothetical protein EDC04DRAFT_2905620 [Pisolithus marmoratus]